jgi:hypothetical protein
VPVPFPYDTLAVPFIKHMVYAMYRWEALQTHTEDLVTDQESYDFYATYLGCPL